MINFINSIIFGIVQGITEFLPVSSSGHLVLLHKLLPLPISDAMTFDIILHSASLLAVLVFFRNDIVILVKAWVGYFLGKPSAEANLAWFIGFAIIPAGIAGLFFDDYIEEKLRSPMIVAFMLVAVGALFIIYEKKSQKLLDLKALTFRKAMTVGLAQVLALIPGTSRSGITIIAGLGIGLKREEAIRFSFLMSVPLILGAVLFKIPDILEMGVNKNELSVLLVSFVATFISAIFTIKFFLKFAKNNSLIPVAIYRFVLAVIVFIYFF